MERHVPVRELNQHTSSVLAEVASGMAVTITRGGRAVARLVPATDGSPALDRLVETGRARAATLTGPVLMPPPCGDENLDVGKRLAETREDERW